MVNSSDYQQWTDCSTHKNGAILNDSPTVATTQHVTGNAIHVGNDLNLAGKSDPIEAARDAVTQNEQQSFSQTAISVGGSNLVPAAVQTGL